jgi:hypothetical protein
LRYFVNSHWLLIAAWISLAGALPLLPKLKRQLHGTALEHAWQVVAFVWAIWIVVPLLDWLSVVEPVASHCLWHLAAVAALLPPIAALGARRPINRAWSLFVLLPLFVVFAWPVVPILWSGTKNPAAFILETPFVLGFLLVSVMGIGNYLGLPQSGPAILWLLAIWLLVIPASPLAKLEPADLTTCRAWGIGSLAVAVWWGWWSGRRPDPSHETFGFERLWIDFRNLFGVVWARRIMERFNDEARRKQAPFRLGWLGLEKPTGERFVAEEQGADLTTAETLLRWNLQKFVDPDWVSCRLANPETVSTKTPA